MIYKESKIKELSGKIIGIVIALFLGFKVLYDIQKNCQDDTMKRIWGYIAAGATMFILLGFFLYSIGWIKI